MIKIEVCFSPALFPMYESKNSVVVVVDILRATSVITTMFINGAKEVIPVKDLKTAETYKKEEYLVVAERDGKKLDFANFGNSPSYFTNEIVNGKTLIYSTTNGTNAITIGENSKEVIIGSYLNFSSTIKYLKSRQSDIILLCAGWKNKFNIEDSLYCGAITNELLKHVQFNTICDSAVAAKDLWLMAEKNLLQYIDKAAQPTRLKNMGFDDVTPYCHEFDHTEIIPVYKNGKITAMQPF